MKGIGIVLKFCGGSIVLTTAILWVTSDLGQPLGLFAGILFGVAVLILSRAATWISDAWTRRLETIRQTKAEAEEARIKEAEERVVAEQAIVLKNTDWFLASPEKIEKALRFIAAEYPETTEQMGAILRQFDQAHEDIRTLNDYEENNDRFHQDNEAFEAVLFDMATNATAIINAVLMNTDIAEKIEEVREENQKILDFSAEIKTIILERVNKRFRERRLDNSMFKLGVIKKVYADLDEGEVPKW